MMPSFLGLLKSFSFFATIPSVSAPDPARAGVFYFMVARGRYAGCTNPNSQMHRATNPATITSAAMFMARRGTAPMMISTSG